MKLYLKQLIESVFEPVEKNINQQGILRGNLFDLSIFIPGTVMTNCEPNAVLVNHLKGC